MTEREQLSFLIKITLIGLTLLCVCVCVCGNLPKGWQSVDVLICTHFITRQRANLQLGDTKTFLINHVYRDDETYVVVGAAAEVLGQQNLSLPCCHVVVHASYLALCLCNY